MYGDYNVKEASWLRLAIHFCDQKERTKLGKDKCAEPADIEEYFRKTLVSLQTI